MLFHLVTLTPGSSGTHETPGDGTECWADILTATLQFAHYCVLSNWSEQHIPC